MENIRFIKWVMSLSERDRSLAIVLTACVGLWIQGLYDRKQYNGLQERYRIEIVKRTDECDEKLTKVLMGQNEESVITRKKLDSLMIANNKIIITNNQTLKRRSR